MHMGTRRAIHSMGGEALDELETARKTIADILGCTPSEIVFTSGGSEADNQALLSAYTCAKAGKKHIVSTAFEHHAVLYIHLIRCGSRDLTSLLYP